MLANNVLDFQHERKIALSVEDVTKLTKLEQIAAQDIVQKETY